MSNYDFKSLNDKEFEVFCADLLGKAEGVRIERFKVGRDGGVDGRFFADPTREVILQCKHWAGTPTKALIKKLKTQEKSKVEKLKPHRYLLAVSNALSRTDKQEIKSAFEPYIKSESDIYGKDDLNGLLLDHPEVERAHYKLWLQSASVLQHIQNTAIFGRSAFSLQEIHRATARYVVTCNHNAALEILEKHGVVIVTGEPGVGKTTLADHLCLSYVTDGFSYLKVADDLKEVEAALVDPESKQVIYFDDFLGRNYLDALKGHEGSHVTQLMRRVSNNKNKRFVLTSRSTILNQGKLFIDTFEHDNTKKSEYELKIQSLTNLDKAHILYNHIWHSQLESEYVEQLYLNKRYRDVIKHRNFNPRLIQYITDASRLAHCQPSQYWDYTLGALNRPAQVWDNPFVAQLDDFGRAIVVLVVLNGDEIEERVLATAYHRYISQPGMQNMSGRSDFQINIAHLVGSFLRRGISADANKPAAIDLFNPSIGDYVLGRTCNDLTLLQRGLSSLRTYGALRTLQSLLANKSIGGLDAQAIGTDLLKTATAEAFSGLEPRYVAHLCSMCRDASNDHATLIPKIQSAIHFVLKAKWPSDQASLAAIETIAWAQRHDLISPPEVLDFLARNIVSVEARTVASMRDMIERVPEETPDYPLVHDALIERFMEDMAVNMEDYIEVGESFDEAGPKNYSEAWFELKVAVENKIQAIGLNLSESEIELILDNFDVDEKLDNHFENQWDGGDDRHVDTPFNSSGSMDEIDDLFSQDR